MVKQQNKRKIKAIESFKPVETENIEVPVEDVESEIIDPILDKKSLFRVYEAAEYFGVHERTIRLWIDHGKLIAEKPAGIIFISRESILKFRRSGLLH